VKHQYATFHEAPLLLAPEHVMAFFSSYEVEANYAAQYTYTKHGGYKEAFLHEQPKGKGS
jgi:hypothetical protein